MKESKNAVRKLTFNPQEKVGHSEDIWNSEDTLGGEKERN